MLEITVQNEPLTAADAPYFAVLDIPSNVCVTLGYVHKLTACPNCLSYYVPINHPAK